MVKVQIVAFGELSFDATTGAWQSQKRKFWPSTHEKK